MLIVLLSFIAPLSLIAAVSEYAFPMGVIGFALGVGIALYSFRTMTDQSVVPVVGLILGVIFFIYAVQILTVIILIGVVAFLICIVQLLPDIRDAVETFAVAAGRKFRSFRPPQFTQRATEITREYDQRQEWIESWLPDAEARDELHAQQDREYLAALKRLSQYYPFDDRDGGGASGAIGNPQVQDLFDTE